MHVCLWHQAIRSKLISPLPTFMKDILPNLMFTKVTYHVMLDSLWYCILQVIGMCHIFSNAEPEKARVMVWVLGGLTGLAG